MNQFCGHRMLLYASVGHFIWSRKKTPQTNTTTMQVIGHRDIFVFIASSLWFINDALGLLATFQFIYQHIFFFAVRLPYIYVCRRKLQPFYSQSNFSQRATSWEFVAVQALRYYSKHIQRTKAGQVFAEGKPFLVLNKVRQLRELSDGLGDVTMSEDNGGFWIKSKSQKAPFDIVVLYIRGGGPVHMYTEYLSMLVINMLKQGFSTPAVFLPNEPTTRQVDSLNCPIVIMSDSIGCASCLSLLGGGCKIAVCVLISPVLCHVEGSSSRQDYMSQRVVDQWDMDVGLPVGSTVSSAVVPAKELPSENQAEVVPAVSILAQNSHELVISYGTDEFNAQDTERLITDLKRLGIDPIIDKQQDSVHNGGLLRFYTERLIDHREASVRTYASLLARMVPGGRWASDAVSSDDESI